MKQRGLATICAMFALSILVIGLAILIQGSTNDPSVVFLSLAGSALYVLSRKELPVIQRWAFFTIGMLVGINSASFGAGVANSLLKTAGIDAKLPHDLSAFIMSSVVVYVLTSVYKFELSESIKESISKLLERLPK